jgi:metal-responsive CopG/Arc/MetJ family transcriptional regulator
MTRKLKAKVDGKAVRVNVVLPSEVLEKIDAMAAELRKQTPGALVTRSEVLRRAIYAYVS